MLTFALPFPAIDPIAIELGPLAIRWYALAYLTGLLGGWWYLRFLARRTPGGPNDVQVDDFLVWATLGVVLGGRLGYVLFYKPSYYLANPLDILKVWQGGMAFHGGVLGVLVAIYLFSRLRKLSFLRLGDLVCAVVPIGLFFGRIANFINGELWGRPAPDVPWAFVFPHGGDVPRHPSQLYEAVLEGLVLFVVLHLLWRVTALRERQGFIAGAFLAGYGISRFIVEFFREPDDFLGTVAAGMTMGQLLSLPMILVGAALMIASGRFRSTEPNGGGRAA
ncbi:phosphatidylglycerol:prolipoprotein diacylglycerol transferase [Caenispirillum bisanense]|uniref:Phosphatidylglycerol--prolipoprotein diacylglyceryl transferase n=1 Tax=Caenispirillum bisanense TaxID=414052 RepID=A0A286GHZ4_9PROT|nr:phosphatidylglycerol:prolipoprotein diacylglycerol transferase [Caenispirillum bisanense]